MVNTVTSTVAEPDSANKLAKSIPQQQRKDPPKERSDSTENQVSTNDFRNSDPVFDGDDGSEIMKMPLEVLISTLEEPKDNVLSPEVATPKRQDLSKIGRMENSFEMGYDSDGEIGPFWGVVKQEGDQLFEEQNLIATEDTRTADSSPNSQMEASTIDTAKAADSGKETVQNNNDNNDDNNDNKLTAAVIGAMQKPMLQNELKLRLESVKGNKNVLVDRLKKSVNRKVKRYGSLEEAQLEKKKKKILKQFPKKRNELDGLKTFHPDARWRELMANSAAVVEPLNPSFSIARAPTLSAAEARFNPVKHNFNETFEVPNFSGVYHKYEQTRRKTLKRDHKGNPVTVETTRTTGRVKEDFKQKHKLSAYSKPWEFAEVFLPFLQDAKDPKQTFSFDLLKQWTNTKAQQVKRYTLVKNGSPSPFVKYDNTLGSMCYTGCHRHLE